MPKTNVKAASKNINKSFKTQQVSEIVSAKDLLKTLSKPMTQTQQLAYLSEVTNLTEKDTSLCIYGLFAMIGTHLKKTGLINLARLKVL